MTSEKNLQFKNMLSTSGDFENSGLLFSDPLPPFLCRDDSSDEGNSDTDSENNEKKQQNIPEWARGEQLKLALEKQYGLNGHIPLDPDKIFPEVQTCSLEEIFGRREGLTRK